MIKDVLRLMVYSKMIRQFFECLWLYIPKYIVLKNVVTLFLCTLITVHLKIVYKQSNQLSSYDVTILLLTEYLMKQTNYSISYKKNIFQVNLHQSIIRLIIYQKSTTMMTNIIVLFGISFLVMNAPSQAPIIGIYTQSDTGDEPKREIQAFKIDGASNYSYIAASYVKYIQMSGAQVVPILAYAKNKTYFDNLLPKINGVLFPGGGYQINIKNTWTSNADYILKYAINQNKKGNPFPVWGTCLGWELLAYLTSDYDSKVLSPVRGESAVRNRIIIKSPSYLFDDLSAPLKNSLQNGVGILYFNHVWAVSNNYYQANQVFQSFWNIVSTTTSSYNEAFISGAESKEYPIYGIQFHPEKNLYEWKVNADRSDNGAQIVQILSNKFVQKARQSKNRFSSSEQFYKVSIYNFKTQKTTQSFTEIYLFNELNSSIKDKTELLKPNLSIE